MLTMRGADYIFISALQHYLYCPRQCALIHLEQAWLENRETAEGRLLHERTEKYRVEGRRGVRTVTAMPLVHHELGIVGVADVVEFHASATGELPYPVEYKRGRPKEHQADEVQLCAQGLCLEAMFRVEVLEGALYYGKTKRRKLVTFDSELRKLTIEIISSTRLMLESLITPAPISNPARCRQCSLSDVCMPDLFREPRDVRTWLLRQLHD